VRQKARLDQPVLHADAELDDIRAATADGSKVLPELAVDVEDESGQVVARVRKTLYVRRKMHAPATRC